MVSGQRLIVLASMTTTLAVVALFRYPTSLGASSVHPSSVVIAAGAPQASPSTATPDAVTPSAGASSAPSTTPSTTPPKAPSKAPSKAPAKVATTQTFNGSVADTRWGPVQVQITVSAGKITSAGVLQVPNGNPRDDEINSQAVPILNSEVVQAQSAKIDTVSGATVTSDGYLTSLQAAFDAAGL